MGVVGDVGFGQGFCGRQNSGPQKRRIGGLRACVRKINIVVRD